MISRMHPSTSSLVSLVVARDPQPGPAPTASAAASPNVVKVLVTGDAGSTIAENGVAMFMSPTRLIPTGAVSADPPPGGLTGGPPYRRCPVEELDTADRVRGPSYFRSVV